MHALPLRRDVSKVEVIYVLHKCCSAVGHKPPLAGSKLCEVCEPKKVAGVTENRVIPWIIVWRGVCCASARARALRFVGRCGREPRSSLSTTLWKECEGKIWGHTFLPQQMLESWPRAPSRANRAHIRGACEFPRRKKEEVNCWLFIYQSAGVVKRYLC